MSVISDTFVHTLHLLDVLLNTQLLIFETSFIINKPEVLQLYTIRTNLISVKTYANLLLLQNTHTHTIMYSYSSNYNTSL